MADHKDPDQKIIQVVPTGMRFRPTDNEILQHLKSKIEDPQNFRLEPMIKEVMDFNNHDPRDLLHGNKHKIAHFFTKRNRNEKRSSEKGSWKIRTKEKIGKHPSKPNVKIGLKRAFTFCNPPGVSITTTTERGTIIEQVLPPRSQFLMHEYQFDQEYQRSNIMIKKEENPPQKKIKIDENSSKKSKLDDDEYWVVCKVYENPREHLKIDEKSIVDFANKCIEEGFDFSFGQCSGDDQSIN